MKMFTLLGFYWHRFPHRLALSVWITTLLLGLSALGLGIALSLGYTQSLSQLAPLFKTLGMGELSQLLGFASTLPPQALAAALLQQWPQAVPYFILPSVSVAVMVALRLCNSLIAQLRIDRDAMFWGALPCRRWWWTLSLALLIWSLPLLAWALGLIASLVFQAYLHAWLALSNAPTPLSFMPALTHSTELLWPLLSLQVLLAPLYAWLMLVGAALSRWRTTASIASLIVFIVLLPEGALGLFYDWFSTSPPPEAYAIALLSAWVLLFFTNRLWQRRLLRA